ncbi:hypothetical protein STEG23_031962 [Scotinomys teguina]
MARKAGQGEEEEESRARQQEEESQPAMRKTRCSSYRQTEGIPEENHADSNSTLFQRKVSSTGCSNCR